MEAKLICIKYPEDNFLAALTSKFGIILEGPDPGELGIQYGCVYWN